jgi:RNA polymerase sigma factor (sigma-70 family)
MMMETQRLLADFVKNGSEAAFRELVGRYTDLVYSTAVRLVGGDTHLAQDVTQTVFIDLARMARKLSGQAMLGGWLHRHTCFVAATVIRGERRRQSRERQAVEMNKLSDPSEPGLMQVASLLDEAINQLGSEDRTALVLRFFEQSDFRSVGEILGINENTARMRVNRAVEKLHALLKQRGVTFPAAALGTALASEAVTAAPVGLAASLSATALAGAADGGGTSLTLLKLVTMTKLKALSFGAIIIAGVTTPLVIHYQAQARLHDTDLLVQQQNDQLAQLAAENARLSNLVAQANDSAAPDQSKELLKLRGEVGVLKGQLAAAAHLQERTKRSAQAKSEVDPAEQQKQISIAKMGYTQGWMQALLQYAGQNQGLFPTNFDQAVSFLPDQVKGETNLAPDQFEIVYQGSMNEITNPAAIIVIREKEAWQTADGGWVRDYSFADGHSEIHKAADGNFQNWEAQHMILPPTTGRNGAEETKNEHQ